MKGKLVPKSPPTTMWHTSFLTTKSHVDKTSTSTKLCDNVRVRVKTTGSKTTKITKMLQNIITSFFQVVQGNKKSDLDSSKWAETPSDSLSQMLLTKESTAISRKWFYPVLNSEVSFNGTQTKRTEVMTTSALWYKVPADTRIKVTSDKCARLCSHCCSALKWMCTTCQMDGKLEKTFQLLC